MVLSVQSLWQSKSPGQCSIIIHITTIIKRHPERSETIRHQFITTYSYQTCYILCKTCSTHCFQSAIFFCLKMQLNGAVRHYAAGHNLLKCWECWAGLLRSDTVTPGGYGAHNGRGAEESAADRSYVWPHRRKTYAPDNTTSVFFIRMRY